MTKRIIKRTIKLERKSYTRYRGIDLDEARQVSYYAKENSDNARLTLCADKLRRLFEIPLPLPDAIWVTFAPHRFPGSDRIELLRTKKGLLDRLRVDGVGSIMTGSVNDFIDARLPVGAEHFYALIEYEEN